MRKHVLSLGIYEGNFVRKSQYERRDVQPWVLSGAGTSGRVTPAYHAIDITICSLRTQPVYANDVLARNCRTRNASVSCK